MSVVPESAAFDIERLLVAMRPRLHRYCARMVGSVIDGEDALQDALIKAVEAQAAAGAIGNPEGWLFRIAHNTALDFLRRLRRLAATDTLADIESVFAPDSPSVVMVRSDWSKKWTTDPVKAKALAADPVFPGVSLKAIQYLHQKRHILFHGHEPLDTDATPTLEGEAWLMHNHFTQAEGVANLDQVPEAGALFELDVGVVGLPPRAFGG